MPTHAGRLPLAASLLILVFAAPDGILRLADAAEGPPQYQGPCALAASADAKVLYVACADACQVAYVELPAGDVARRISVPSRPTGLTLTPDGTSLLVTCAAPKSTAIVLDATSGEVMAAIPAGHTATSPVVSPDGRHVYVCNRFDNDVSVIDWAAGREVLRVPVVREPIAAAVTPDGRTLLVANHLPSSRTDGAAEAVVTPVVTAVDTETLQTTAIEWPQGADSLRDICVSPDGRFALVTHLLGNFEQIPFRVDTGWINVNVVTIIDVRGRKARSTIGMDDYYLGSGNPFGVTYTADGKSVCVCLAGAHKLCVIGSSDLLGEFAHRTMRPMMGVWPIYLSLGESLWQRHKLPGNGPRGLAAAGSKVFVAQYFSDTIAVVDLHTPSAPSIDTIALGPPPQLTSERRGELLFNDASICYQQWLSCASCHPDGRTDGLTWDLMNDGQGNSKNTKSMLLAHQTPPAMAEGVRSSAELAVRAGLRHILFADRPEEEAVAIDAYLKSLQPVPSPHLLDGRLSPAAQRGQKLFESAEVGCRRCHPAPTYTDRRAHNVGTQRPDERSDRFDTPALVEVWRTAPYLHDGRYMTIKELLVEGSHGLRSTEELSEQQIDDLVEFVLSL